MKRFSVAASLAALALFPLATSLAVEPASNPDDVTEERSRLFRTSDQPLAQCCSEGGQCLSILTRTRANTVEEIEAACAALGIASSNRPRVQGCRQRPPTSLFGIANDELRDHGWWQDGPPRRSWAPRTYRASHVAASTDGCATLPIGPSHVVAGWAEARERCARTGYKTVRLYISMATDFVDGYLNSVAAADPWLDDSETEDRVYSMRALNAEDIQRVVGGLLSRCEVADHVLVASHGNAGILSFLNKKNTHNIVSLREFLTSVLSPCVLAPNSRVQFIGCQIACGAAAETARVDLEQLYTAPRFRTSGYQSLGGTQVLLSTSLNNASGEGDWTPRGGQSIEYTVSDNRVTTDIPTASAQACGAH